MKKVFFLVYSLLVEVFIIFSVCLLFIAIIGAVFGESAKELSTLFALGGKGLAFSTIAQLFASSLIIAGINTIINRTKLFEKVMTLWKTVIMLLVIIAVTICFVLAFGWIPVDNIYAWIGFALSFGSGFAISTVVMIIKTRLESQRYERSFLAYKKNHSEGDDHE